MKEISPKVKRNSKVACAFAAIAFLILTSVYAGAEMIDRVVAIVGPEVITLSELEEFSAQLQNIPQDKALELLIQDLLVEQEAKRQGITVTDTEVEASVQGRMAELGVSEDEFNKMLGEQGLSQEQFRERVRSKLMKFKFVQQQVRGGIEVSDEEVLNFYRLHQSEMQQGEQLHLAHIFLPFPLDSDVEQQEKARKLAAEIHERLVKGEDFEALAAKYSKGSGDLGWMKSGELNPAFQAALKNLKPGQFSAAFETDQGMHILKIIESKQSEAMPFEDVKRKIYEYLYDQKMQEELYRLVQEIQDRTPIERKL